MRTSAIQHYLLVLFALSTTPFVRSQHAYAQCTAYQSGICSDYINYNVYLPPNVTFDLIEQQLAGTLTGISAQLNNISYACVEAYYQYACPFYFTKCSFDNNNNTTTASGSGQWTLEPSCTSACQKVVQECSIMMTGAGQASLVPNCEAPSPVTELSSEADGICNAVDPKDPVKAAQGLNLAAVPAGFVLEECHAPFVKDPMAKAGTNDTIDSTYCRFGCCVPCPSQNYFYKTGWVQRGFLATDVIRITSSVFSIFILVSYLVLPNKRKHRNTIVVNVTFSITLFSIPSFFSIGDPTRIQCSADGIRPSIMDSNSLCAAQGAILIFATFASIMWCVIMILNLHLHTVWNSTLIDDKYLYIHVVCWGVPCAVLGTALGLRAIKFEFANLCLIQVEYVFEIFFYPLASLVIPSFIAHCCTFLYIGKITFRSGIEAEMTQSLSSNHGISRPDAQQAARIRRHHHVVEAVKIQWRALMMATAMTISVVFYWLFYFIHVRKMTVLKYDRDAILPWLGCMMTFGNTQDDCLAELGDYMPPYGLTVFAEALVSAMGISVFLNFFKWELLREWKDLFSKIRFSYGSQRPAEKNREEFIAL